MDPLFFWHVNTLKLKELKRNWDELGKSDPLWAILVSPSKRGGKWEVDKFFKTGEKAIKSTIEYVHTLGINITTSRALDFGCGVGRLTQALAHYFDEVYGVDISNTMIELAKHYNHHEEDCKYYVNTFDDLRIFSDEFFTFVLSYITLQHIEPQYSMNYIREFVRILKPGGLLIIQLPSQPESQLKRLIPKQIRHLLHKLIYIGRPHMEMNGIKKAQVLKLLRSCGMKILDVHRDHAARTWISYRYYALKK